MYVLNLDIVLATSVTMYVLFDVQPRGYMTFLVLKENKLFKLSKHD